MRREQHGLENSWHADLGWIDGFQYAMLAREWEELQDSPAADKRPMRTRESIHEGRRTDLPLSVSGGTVSANAILLHGNCERQSLTT